ncbi:unnamed protein product [Linum tenue]|uniref:Uncharacterized protein n=1 Tax=Linum tenue TaxID=586396 RepID=A0AAV0NQ85_9ROSI|nr:unnamed protein product [Linum tenue]
MEAHQHLAISINMQTQPSTNKCNGTPNSPPQSPSPSLTINDLKPSSSPSTSSSFLLLLSRFHAGYFRITLSLTTQALLWKTLILSPTAAFDHPLRRVPSAAFTLLWSLSFLTLAAFSSLYLLRCLLRFRMVKSEFLHHVGVNYLFAPWISWLLLLLSSPTFLSPETTPFHALWCVFAGPILALDVKIYGQWFTKGKRFLSTVANPTSQMSVIGNLVGARAAAEMGWREVAVCLFSLGMAHYLVLFVTLYQRLSGGNCLPSMLRPVFFLFFAAPSMASLAWVAICGRVDTSAKMLFFLSLFLFLSLVSRPTLFKKSMRKFNVAWWAYSFPLTVLALASVDYAQEVKGAVAHALTLLLSSLSILVSFALMVFTVLNSHMLFPDNDPGLRHSSSIDKKNNKCTDDDFGSTKLSTGCLTIKIEPSEPEKS